MSEAIRIATPADFCPACREHFERMVEGLSWTSRMVNQCHGHGKRWMNRAYRLGGEILGLPFPVAREVFEKCAHGDVRQVAFEYRDMIIGGALPMGRVYFAQDIRSGNWKIGFSHEPTRRVAQLSGETRLPIQLVATVDGFMLNEHVIHSKLMPARMAHEWFRDQPIVHDYIASRTGLQVAGRLLS